MNTHTISRFLKASLIASCGIVISGCASLSKDECLQGRWQDIGYEDGSKGYKPTRFESHRKACAEHGVAANFGLYETGYQDGLRYYCAPPNGLRVGEQGNTYEWVCPPHLETGFLRQYLNGLETRRRDVDYDLQTTQDELFDRMRDLRHTDNPDRREDLEKKIDSLESQRESLKSEYDDLYGLINRARQRLDDLHYQRERDGYQRVN